MTFELSEAQVQLARESIPGARQALEWVIGHVRESTGIYEPLPNSIRAFQAAIAALEAALGPPTDEAAPANLDISFAPILRSLIQTHRRAIAEQVERFRLNVTDPELLARIELRLTPFDDLLKQEWFSTHPRRAPRLSDYLTGDRVSAIENPGTRPHEPRDEKFGILLAPSMILPGLRNLRGECEARDVSLSVLFLDIDDFKALNTKYGEPRVDRDVLPVFMRAIERFFFGFGRVYRHGGDEFVVLLPNCTQWSFMDSLQSTIATVEYPGIPERPTMSGGLCRLDPTTWLTDREALELASRAKKEAKRLGKNTIAGFSGNQRLGAEEVSSVHTPTPAWYRQVPWQPDTA